MIVSPAVNDLDYQSLVNWDDPLTQGLVYWHLNLPGRWGGVRAYDLVCGRVSTRTSMASPATSTSGQGTTIRPGGWGEERFDGTDDLIIVGSATTFDLERTQPFSIFLALRAATTAPVSQAIFVKQMAGSPYSGWSLTAFNRSTLDGTALTLSLNGTSGDSNYLEARSPTGSIAANISYRVGVTYNGSSDPAGVLFYLNGIPQATTSTGNGTLASSILCSVAPSIGARDPSGPIGHFSGSIDDVMLFSRTLAPAEAVTVSEDMRTFHPRMLPRAGVPVVAMTAAAGTVLPEAWMQYRSRRVA